MPLKISGQGGRGSSEFWETRQREGGRNELGHPLISQRKCPQWEVQNPHQKQVGGGFVNPWSRVSKKPLAMGNADSQEEEP